MKLRPNEPNNFYLRFEADNTRDHCADGLSSDLNNRVLIDSYGVTKTFKSMHVSNRAKNMSTFLLKTFADELTEAWQQLFQLY